jgi:hypothetical protein
MADIFDEINEELKQDRMSALWARYGVYLMVATGVVIAVVVFTQTYKQWQVSRNEQAAETFYQAMMGDDAAAAFEVGRDDFTKGYQMLADFKIASDKATSGDKQGAEELYLALSKHDNIAPLYRDLALLLAAMNAPESRTPDNVISMLAPLTDGPGPFQGLALEVAAGADVQAGRVDAAIEKLSQIQQLADVSAPLRQRSVELKKILGER